MTQHFYRTEHEGHPVEVMMGWDRPLQGYFMSIELLDSHEDDEEDNFLYSNLSDPQLHSTGGYCKSLDYFLDRLSQLRIVIPPDMRNAVRHDGEFNVAPYRMIYQDGTAKDVPC